MNVSCILQRLFVGERMSPAVCGARSSVDEYLLPSAALVRTMPMLFKRLFSETKVVYFFE
jgi:hypothetical protein